MSFAVFYILTLQKITYWNNADRKFNYVGLICHSKNDKKKTGDNFYMEE